MPCNYMHSDEDTINPECINDLEKQQQYLTTLTLHLFMSEKFFDLKAYEDEKIVKRSRYHTVQIDNKTPNFVDFAVTKSALEDESSFWSFYPDEDEFYIVSEERQVYASAWNNFPTA